MIVVDPRDPVAGALNHAMRAMASKESVIRILHYEAGRVITLDVVLVGTTVERRVDLLVAVQPRQESIDWLARRVEEDGQGNRR
jgi:hypothetical protein